MHSHVPHTYSQTFDSVYYLIFVAVTNHFNEASIYVCFFNLPFIYFYQPASMCLKLAVLPTGLPVLLLFIYVSTYYYVSVCITVCQSQTGIILGPFHLNHVRGPKLWELAYSEYNFWCTDVFKGPTRWKLKGYMCHDTRAQWPVCHCYVSWCMPVHLSLCLSVNLSFCLVLSRSHVPMLISLRSSEEHNASTGRQVSRFHVSITPELDFELRKPSISTIISLIPKKTLQ